MRSGVRAAAFAPLAVLLASTPLSAQPVQGGPLPGPLPLFPADNWWNVDVSAAPVDPASAAFIAWIGAAKGMHPDFGGDVSTGSTAIYGMPYVVVPGTQALEPMAFDYASESDAGAPGRPAGYPIPVEAKTQSHWIEGGYPGNCDASYAGSPCRGDKHMLIVDADHRLLFETWNTRCLPSGSPACAWRAGSGAVFSLDSNARRPDGWTSADAAGLAILPGLVRWDEAYGASPIRHAFRVTVRDTNGYVYPASHVAGSNANAPPMGARLRLRASKDISGFTAPVQRIFQAMKTYGLIVADNGSDMYVQGTYDVRWDNGVLNPAFGAITAGDFEVVQLGWQPSAPPAATRFRSVPPCRVVDTRTAQGAPPIAANASRTFVLTGTCGVSATAVTVSANVTVVAPRASGDLVFFPAGTGVPNASTLSFRAGRTRANNTQILLSSDGTGRATAKNNAAGALDLVIDVSGYYE
ncbi:MAG TPA: hypothetical protein PLB01_10910 [Thermoanaerobaculia bacterium]|nr:hypothetical protein [Thermoanaerobaculia bacterium]